LYGLHREMEDILFMASVTTRLITEIFQVS